MIIKSLENLIMTTHLVIIRKKILLELLKNTMILIQVRKTIIGRYLEAFIYYKKINLISYFFEDFVSPQHFNVFSRTIIFLTGNFI